jgi:hypothetical protein
MHRYAHLEEAARAAVAHPAKQRLRGTHGWVTQNEGVWSATWEEHGVTYVAEFLCDDPSEARCATADALLAEIESLAYVGGQGGAR